MQHLHWKLEEDWSRVIFSDEIQLVIGKDKRVYVWRTNEEKWRPRCSGVYQEKFMHLLSVMFWGCLICEGVGTFGLLRETLILGRILKCLMNICSM